MSKKTKYFFTNVEKMAKVFAEDHENKAKVLRTLDFSPGIKEIHLKWGQDEDQIILGDITSMDTADNIQVRVIAANFLDHKMRNISARGFKRRTYPISLNSLISITPVKKEDIPLYINYKYLSPQFKTKYLS